VVRLLEHEGYEIVARNLRLGYLELDIVARADTLIIVVEVRLRSSRSRTTAFGSIAPAKRQRLRWAAQRLWNRRYSRDPTVERLRIDAVSVAFHGERAIIEYCAGAITLEPV
jgi:putative endonuclease